MTMQKRILTSALILGLAGSVQAAESVPTSILVCQSHQCAAADYSMTRGFLFNKISQLMSANAGKTALLCEADPVSHVCLQDGLRISAKAAFAETNIVVPSVRIIDSKLLKGETGLDVVLDYQVTANKTVPRCQATVSRLTVSFVDKVELMTPDFTCDITETGRTSLNATFNVDYIDFDYGFIGAYYTLGIGEAVQGDKSGYALFRFTGKTAGETPVMMPAVKQDPIIVKVPVPVVVQAAVSEEVTEPQAVELAKKETPVAPEVVEAPVSAQPTVIVKPVVPARSSTTTIQVQEEPIRINEQPIEKKDLSESVGQTLNRIIYLENNNQ